MTEPDPSLLSTFAADPPSLLIAGPGGGEVARALIGATPGWFGVVATGHPEGWAPGLSVLELGGEVTPSAATRSALRQDPDLVALEVERAAFDREVLAMALTAALTGHVVVLHVRGCSDEEPLREGLAAYLEGQPDGFPNPFKRVLVCDPDGVERVVTLEGSPLQGNTVWRRGQPLPDRATLTGQAPRPEVTTPQPAETPALEAEALAALRAALEPHLRTSFRPRLAEASGQAACSKLGGLPLLASGEAWPRCGSCGEPMPLALQLARSECPEPAQARFPAEHLQLFYCSSSGCGAGDAWEPFASNRLLRFLGEGQPAEELLECPEPTQSVDITGWDERRESPHSEDLSELPGELDELDEDRWQLQDRVDAGLASPEEATLAGPALGNRLLGWPHWSQGAEWPSCPRCQERMAFLFQIDANSGPLQMLFAADGTGHVTQCPSHPEVLAFAWACG